MAGSAIEICNEALLMLGADPIANFTEGSDRAKICAGIYAPTRDAVLRSHPWNFAVVRTTLAPLAAAPAYDYSAQFQLPSDLLRLLEVSETDYQLEGRSILCDADSLNIRYVSRIEDTSLYDTMFTAALAAFLASKMAYALTKSNTTAQSMLELYKGIMPSARAVDAQENPVKDFGDFPFLNARGS